MVEGAALGAGEVVALAAEELETFESEGDVFRLHPKGRTTIRVTQSATRLVSKKRNCLSINRTLHLQNQRTQVRG